MLHRLLLALGLARPFLLAIGFPGAASAVEAAAARLGPAHVVDFPFMVRDDLPLEPSGNVYLVAELGAPPWPGSLTGRHTPPQKNGVLTLAPWSL